MTANCEPSNQSFETDREATVCTASRRFLPFCGREVTRRCGKPLAGRRMRYALAGRPPRLLGNGFALRRARQLVLAVVAMMIVVMMVAVPRCGWDRAADRDCANNT